MPSINYRTFSLGLLLAMMTGLGCGTNQSPAVNSTGANSTVENGGQATGGSIKLLNVSYDPTRELWKDLNKAFVPQYEKETGQSLTIDQSHGGSASQARAIIDGMKADVATLSIWTDTDGLRKNGLLKEGWEDALPNKSLPYTSTVVFVVRSKNPKEIKDWNDLVKSGVEVITPNPKTSGNGRLSLLRRLGQRCSERRDRSAGD